MLGLWPAAGFVLNINATHTPQATLPLTEKREETPADKKQERKFGF